MELRAYLDTLPHGGVADFAKKCGIAESYLFQLAPTKLAKEAEKRRVASPALAVVIERESGGLVTRQDSRPDDYADIWPDLAPKRAA
jgi:DNA-binding transcriptional regulator YdaS (Cro superfamily)